MRINKLIRILFYILAIILPVQTLLVQFFINKLGYPEYLALWKELILVVLVGYFLFLTSKIIYQKFSKLNRQDFIKYLSKQQLLLIVLALLHIIIVLNSFIFNSTSLNVFILGYRFEIFWLVFFVVIVNWLNLKDKTGLFEDQEASKGFFRNLRLSIFAGFIASSFVSFSSLVFGSTKVLGFFGFQTGVQADSLVTQAIVCNPADFGSDTCRLSGSFASPNHFSGYLLLVLPIFLVTFIEYFKVWHSFHISNKTKIFSKNSPIWKLILISFGIVSISVFIMLSISRFAWLGMAVFIGLIIIYFGYQMKLYQLLKAKIFFGILLFIPIFIGVLAINIDPAITSKYLPNNIVKPSSTIEHYRHTITSLDVLNTSGRYLQGFGLGASGSSAVSLYQDIEKNPIYRDYRYITLKYFIFPHRVTIPENWYISVILNGGIFYAFLYFILVLWPLGGIYKFFKSAKFSSIELKQLLYGLGFFSILIGNLFLHIWENQTIAIYWTLLAIITSKEV